MRITQFIDNSVSIWRSTVPCIDCWLSINIATQLKQLFTCLTLPQLFCIHNNTLVALENVLIRFKVILYLITCYFSGYMLPFSVIWIRARSLLLQYTFMNRWKYGERNELKKDSMKRVTSGLWRRQSKATCIRYLESLDPSIESWCLSYGSLSTLLLPC